jgi:hypothetical protein
MAQRDTLIGAPRDEAARRFPWVSHSAQVREDGNGIALAHIKPRGGDRYSESFSRNSYYPEKTIQSASAS